MSPGEEDENEFIEDVGIGDIEVVFQGGNRDVAIELLLSVILRQSFCQLLCQLLCQLPGGTSYILFHILLPSRHGRLAHLESHLSRGIGHEPPEPGAICATATLHGRRLVWIAISRHLRLLRHWRRRGAHHGHRRHMLRYWVMKRRRLCWRRNKRLAIHVV